MAQNEKKIPNGKVLTYQQAKELKWFCGNVSGVRKDMYDTIDAVSKFDDRIKRLEKTCEMIEKFLSEEKPTAVGMENTGGGNGRIEIEEVLD